MIRLSLPYPPSTNNLFKNASKGRVKTDAYKAWIETAHWQVKQQRPGKILGKFVLTITATRPDRRARDIDNLAKPTLDLLVRAAVIEEDHLAESVTLRWAGDIPVPGGALFVEVEPYAAPALAVAA